MKPLYAQILARALALSGVPVYDGQVKSDDVRKLFKSEASEEVEVDFDHGGSKWVAVFDVLDRGHKPGGTTPETYDPGCGPELELTDIYLKSDPTADVKTPDLSAKELEDIEDKAAEELNGWDQ